MAPLMAEESARPYFTYSPLYPAERAFTSMFAEIEKGDVLVPSPLLTFSSPADPPPFPVWAGRPPQLAAGPRRQHARPGRGPVSLTGARSSEPPAGLTRWASSSAARTSPPRLSAQEPPSPATAQLHACVSTPVVETVEKLE